MERSAPPLRSDDEVLTPGQVDEYWARLAQMKEEYEAFAKTNAEDIEKCAHRLAPFLSRASTAKCRRGCLVVGRADGPCGPPCAVRPQVLGYGDRTQRRPREGVPERHRGLASLVRRFPRPLCGQPRARRVHAGTPVHAMHARWLVLGDPQSLVGLNLVLALVLVLVLCAEPESS
eukprot:COSAG06_NODE_208_length_20182_cov_31.214759_13_plen_175_part_00